MAKYKSIVVTNTGLELIASTHSGDTVRFTAVKTGNGVYDGTEVLEDMLGLKSIRQSFGVNGITRENTVVKVCSVLSNEGLTEGYCVTEIGLYALDPHTDKEVLYAIIIAEHDMEDYFPPYADSPQSMTLEMYINAEGVEEGVTFTASILDEVYVPVQDFETHIKTSNPHGVTAKQVGLGNVPNVATNDQTPTYETYEKLTNLKSGEKISTAFGKLAVAVTWLNNHLLDKNNPHNVTAKQLGMGNVDNTKDADKPISKATQNALDEKRPVSAYANGLTTSINDLISDGAWRIWIQNNSDDATYLGWGGHAIIENFVSNSCIFQRITRASNGAVYLRWNSAIKLSYDLTLIPIGDYDALGEASTRDVTNLASKGSLGLISLTDDGLKLPTIGTLAWWDGTFDVDGTKSNLSYCAKGAFGDVVTKDVLNKTSQGDLGFVASTAQLLVPTVSAIAYWNGAFTGVNSNLTYCKKGAFGDACIKGVDNALIKNSDNLITSGSVYSELEKLNFYQKEIDVTWSNHYIKSDNGSLVENAQYYTSNLIKLSKNDVLKYRATASDTTVLLAKYDLDGNFEVVVETGGKWHVIDRYYHADEDCYVRICKRYEELVGQNCFVVGEYPTYVINKTLLMQSPLYGKSMLVIGDSLVAGNANGSDVVWVNQLGMKYNMTTYNYGINGNAISNISGATGTCMSKRYLTIYDEVSNPDIIVIEGGANDKNHNCPLGTNTDATNDTFKGALNVLINGLREKYPEKTILFMTNFERYGNTNSLGLSETDYANAMLEVCRLKGIPCFDNIGDSGLSFLDNNMLAWIDEGMYRENLRIPNKHFSPKAYTVLAGKYEKWIEGNLPL